MSPSYRDLQRMCKAAGLPANGSVQALEIRLKRNAQETRQEWFPIESSAEPVPAIVAGDPVEDGAVALHRLSYTRGKVSAFASAARLHRHAGSSNDALKEMVLNDCQSWIVSASLVMTLGLGGMFISPADMAGVGTERSVFDVVALHLYLSSMALSSMIALYCVVDHISIYNFFNMVPASLMIEARMHLLTKSTKTRGRVDKLLHSCGLAYGSGVFFQSVQTLIVGTICGIYLAHGAACCVFPSVICATFFIAMRDYNRLVHWGPDALHAFEKDVSSRAERNESN